MLKQQSAKETGSNCSKIFHPLLQKQAFLTVALWIFRFTSLPDLGQNKNCIFFYYKDLCLLNLRKLFKHSFKIFTK